jgi:hypothetical protein
MSSLFKNFATDHDAEQNGKQVTFPPNEDGTIPTFYVRRAGGANTQWQAAMNRATRPYRREMELADGLSEDKANAILMEVFCDVALVKWENVYDTHNKPIVYSKKAAKELFTVLPDLLFNLMGAARDIATFRETVRDAEAKN